MSVDTQTDWWAIAAEGAIGGVVVVAGVVLAAWIDGMRRRRRAIEVAFHSLDDMVAVVVAGLVDKDEDRSYRSSWWATFRQTTALLQEIQLEARGFRGASDIATAAQQLLASLTAAQWALQPGEALIPTTAIDEFGITTLQTAIFHRRGGGEPWAPGRFEELVHRMRTLVQP